MMVEANTQDRAPPVRNGVRVRRQAVMRSVGLDVQHRRTVDKIHATEIQTVANHLHRGLWEAVEVCQAFLCKGPGLLKIGKG